MRIISGKFKGRKLKTPQDLTIRPTLDRVKESIFNVLGTRIAGARVLDLFAGTGSLGLEALSRGARLVHFVDKDIQSMGLMRYNTENLTSGVPGVGDFDILQQDVLEYLRFCNSRKWDIIFLDPPYRIDTGSMKDIFDTISARKIAGRDTILVYEFFFKRPVAEETGCMELVKESFFGDKKVVYLKPREVRE